MNKQLQILIGAGVGILAFAALLTYFLYLPKLRDVRQARAVLATEQERLKDAKEKAKEEDSLDRRSAEIQRGLDYVNRRLPSKVVMQEILDEVSRAAVKSGVHVGMMEVQKPVVAGGASDVAIRSTIRGTFQTFGGFLTELFGEPRAFTVSDVQIDAQQGVPGSTVFIQIVLHAYVVESAS